MGGGVGGWRFHFQSFLAPSLFRVSWECRPSTDANLNEALLMILSETKVEAAVYKTNTGCSIV